MANELLEKILLKLEKIDSKIAQMDNKIEQMDIKFNTVATKENVMEIKSQMNYRFDTLETETSFMKGDVSEIKEIVQRIEKGEPLNITTMLKQINKKLDNKINDKEFMTLDEKVSGLESDVKLIKKVITNQ